MTPYPILFNQTPDSLRRIGARGGRAHARNWRARQLAARLVSTSPTCPPDAPVETTAEAIATLDAQFPWLCRAERRTARH
jgi:hypothetical protein